MEEIFISYKSERRRAAEHLAEVLRRHGYSVWFDYHLIKGEDFDFQLDARLVAAKAVVVLWCTQAVESKWVSREAARAAQRGTLVPAMIETCELKTAHVNADYIDLRQWDGGPRAHALDPLLDAVEAKIGRAPLPDVKALRVYEETWRRFGAPSLKAFVLDGPSETAAARTADRPAAGGGALQGSVSRAPEAALVWPEVRDSGDVRRLKRFEEMFAGTFYAAEAGDLREAIEAARLKPLRTLKGHLHYIPAVAVTPNGRFAISGSVDKNLKVWDIATGQEVRTLTGHTGWVFTVAVTPDSRFVVSCSADETLKVWEITTGRELRALIGHLDRVMAVAVTPDGRLAVSCSYDKSLKVWELATGRELRTLVGHSDVVSHVAVTPDGLLAVSCGHDKSLKIWDIATGRELRTLIGHADKVTTVAVTPDGCLAVSCGNDKSLKIWDIATGRELRTLTGHSDTVTYVAVTPDGRLAVSCSHDKSLKIWDIATGRELRTLTGHSDKVSVVAITPDGRLVVSGGYDQTVKVWDISDL